MQNPYQRKQATLSPFSIDASPQMTAPRFEGTPETTEVPGRIPGQPGIGINPVASTVHAGYAVQGPGPVGQGQPVASGQFPHGWSPGGSASLQAPGHVPGAGPALLQPGFGNPAVSHPAFGGQAIQQPGVSQPAFGGQPIQQPGVSQPAFGSPNDRIRAPPMDLLDEGESLVLEFELPGISKKDIELVGKQRGLVLEAGAEETLEEGEVLSSERMPRRYRREVPLGVDILPEEIQATFQNGILRVTLPKKEPTSAPRTIEIK